MIHRDATIVVVDDHPTNIELLVCHLENAGYRNFLVAKDGIEAWDMLLLHHSKIDLILLDRMMPGMNGIQVMEKIRHHPQIRHIPVIMQTASVLREHMIEGIKAGVTHYLTKPYDEATLLALVAAAIGSYRQRRVLKEEAVWLWRNLHLLGDHRFRISTLEDARYLASFLSGLFPDPESAIVGLCELFINAIEHGNLGITYEEKSELLSSMTWEEEVFRRQGMPENAQKWAEVCCTRTEDEITLSVKDQGTGFDWKRYLEIDPTRAVHSHGRGIALARRIAFDHLDYKGCGNEVHCRVALPAG